MKFNFPQTVYVLRNTPGDQIDHILSEVDEIEELGPELEYACRGTQDETLRKIDLEVMDLLHSCETFFRILSLARGRGYVQGLFDEVMQKNLDRGYYEVSE